MKKVRGRIVSAFFCFYRHELLYEKGAINMTEQERNDARNRLDSILKEPPKVSMRSSLDSMRLNNSDIGLDDAVKNNGGRFFVCNANILAESR
jgi:hypothetical protein